MFRNFPLDRREAVSLRTQQAPSWLLGALFLIANALSGCSSSADETVTLEYAKGALTQSGVTSSLVIHDDWGTGFCGSVSVVNKGPVPIRNWQLVLSSNGVDFGRQWNGLRVETHSRVVVAPDEQDATLPIGGTASVPFCGRGVGRPTLQSMTFDNAYNKG